MKLSAPKQIVFLIAVVIAVVALLQVLGFISIPALEAAWTALIAFAVLCLGNLLKGF